MICPLCKKTSHPGKVYLREASEELQAVDVFWAGLRCHIHDPNRRTERWNCEDGHCWTIYTYPICPACDYIGGPKQSVVIEVA